MRALITAVAIAAGLAAGLSHCATADHYKLKHANYVTSVEKAEADRAKNAKKDVDYYAKKYIEAISADPTIITERVFVKAAPSDVQAGRCTGVGDGSAPRAFELDPATVRGATAVTDDGDRRYEAIWSQLAACQALLRP